ncbi:MAG: AraC family transcriptional regulator [Chthoniobacterales bacterium]
MKKRGGTTRKPKQVVSGFGFNIVVSVSTKCGRGWNLPLRPWPDHRLLLVRSGSGELIFTGHSCKLRRGDLVFGIPGETYGFTQDERAPLVISVIRFELLDAQHRKTKLPSAFRPEIRMQLEGFPLLEQLMLRLTNSVPSLPYYADNASNALLHSILWLIREDGHRNDTLQSTGLAFQELKPALDYPFQPGKLSPGTEQLARLCGMTVNKFRRRIRLCFDQSPKQFFLQRRMEHAKILLLESPYTVEAITAELGYRETAHFCRQFKKVTGLSPGSFRTSRQ